MRLQLLPILSLLLLAAEPAVAQVTVDLHALQALPERHAAPAPRRPMPEATARATPDHGAPARSVERTNTRPAAEAASTPKPAPNQTAPNQTAPNQTAPNQTAPNQTARDQTAPNQTARAEPAPAPTREPSASTLPTPPQQAPALPQAPPQTASINPVAPPPPPVGAAPPPPPPVSATAGTVAAPTDQGLRLTFEPGKSDLTPTSADEIKKLTTALKLGDTTTFNVAAYAPGTRDDPSTARRLSLSRAMAVRQALVADGVPSPRIFVRALGAEYGSGPADRVDIDVQGAEPQAASK